jgi:hypothetical protein
MNAHPAPGVGRAFLRRRRRSRIEAALALALLLGPLACGSGSRHSTLPAALTDEQFWDLSTAFSEPAGTFTHSENLVSNEAYFAHAVRALRPAGGVYIGVGPEQNFSYIARLRPVMAFIIDIRRENRDLHLLYKALFDVSADRADFLSRLFSRERPPDLDGRTSVRDLFAAYAAASASPQVYESTLQMVRERLLDSHGLPLVSQDLEWIGYALHAFYTDGPGIHYGRSRPRDAPGPSYQLLMTATDVGGESRSYLASEDAFAFVKDLHRRNLIVPLIGDFAGPATIRRTAGYLRQHHALVTAFYGSNVEVYLTREKTRAFCNSLATLPYESGSWFIGNKGIQSLDSKMKSCSPGPPHPTWTPER